MINLLFAILLLLPNLCLGENLHQSFPPGQGSTFKLDLNNGAPAVDVSIYVASASAKSIHIEYFIQAKHGLIPIEMWQQFEIEVKSNGPVEILKGYVQTRELKHPEVITGAYLKGFGGVQVNDFLFASQQDLNKNKIGIETLEIAAGKTLATHYRTVSNEVTVDYWISSEAKPIGLVKLISSSAKNKDQNYKLELSTLMEKVKPHIDPARAVPLTSYGKSLLAAPPGAKK